MLISDWSSDVCSSDLIGRNRPFGGDDGIDRIAARRNEGDRRASRRAGFGDLFGREIPCDIVETDIAGVRADALIIVIAARETQLEVVTERDVVVGANDGQDRKSTRLNSSH